MNWLTLAQSVPDAKELASADAQGVLAWVVGGLVLSLVFLVGLLLKQAAAYREDLRQEEAASKLALGVLQEKNDKLQDKLLRVVQATNTYLTNQPPTNPLDGN